jgi:cysteine sulfinate desulfinase/cysteine desulfurase-like protein
MQYLDEFGISVSGTKGEGFETVHFTLSKFNTPEEIDYVIDNLSAIYERISY